MAALGEPLAVAVHAVNVRSDIRSGQKVVVSGPGPIGVLCGMLAKLAGADVLLTGVGHDSDFRLPAAESAGLRAVNLSDAPLEEHLRREFGGEAPELWIESSGSVKALDSAIRSLRPGGTLTVVGLYADEMLFPTNLAVRSELSVSFSYSCNRADYRTALELLSRGDIDPAPFLTKYPLEDAPEAFEAAGKGRAVKAMLVP